ncbi:Alpha/beta hydrolase fold-containing protein [Desulfonema limicola]|uniref:Alpha/beta hydrolase fold-containing protein n=1 Tax=Desulfonema limicola TaxID=45656 RepID=A0A975B4L0_9BACT|nr:alpha/beta hydrolase [Desulfonema limicola]QTA78700.1 Alpha/beta hydrolase fold-containing protein [Desulfonema limicola]
MKADIYEYRKWDNNDAAIVFIHGFSGDIEKTWGKFPEYLLNNQEIFSWNIFSIGYTTTLIPFESKGLWTAYPGILSLADALRTKMEAPPFNKYKEIAFISHSMGGIILQQTLVDSPGLVKNTSFVFCFGTPSLGLTKASAFMHLFRRRQIQDMNSKGDLIQRLRREWGNKIGIDNPPFYFRSITGMQDEFVNTYASQTPFPQKMNKTIPGNHLSIVKPDSPDHEAVQIVVNALIQSQGKKLKFDRENLLKPNKIWPFSNPINTDKACYCIDLEQEKIYQINEKISFSLQLSALNSWNIFKIDEHDKGISLNSLVSTIDHFDIDQIKQYLNDENNSQFMFGRYLYKNIFNDIPFSQIRPQTGETQLLFITSDNYFSRLPWHLLADRRGFLTNCSVSICPDLPEKDAELPKNPILLAVSSYPVEKKPEMEIHIKNLKKMLIAHDSSSPPGEKRLTMNPVERKMLLAHDSNFLPGERFISAQFLTEFKRKLKEISPQAIYLNTPFTGTAYNPKIVFNDNNELAEMQVTELAELLEQKDRKPIVLYLNSFEGSASVITGAARILLHQVPAVIAVRSPALGKAALKQALMFWHGLFIRGLPPHKIISKMAWNTSELSLNIPDPRWAVPILYRNYDKWKSYPPKTIKRDERDPYWSFKLDRVQQFTRVFSQVFDMFHEKKPKSCAYLWYGKPDQGVDIFLNRLKVEFQEKLKQVGMIVKNPIWPHIIDKPEKSYSQMMCQAFGTEDLKQIPMKIREQLNLMGDKKGLVYIGHEPVRYEYQCSPENLETYIKWWDSEFVKLLPEKTYSLLGIPFINSDPKKFLNLLTETLKLDRIDLKRTVFQILDELDCIELNDLITFVKTHNILIPEENRNMILSKILDNTNGQYNKVIDELQKHENKIWKKSVSDDTEEIIIKDDAKNIISYNLRKKASPKEILLGGITTISINWEPFETDSDATIIEIPAFETDLSLFLHVPPGFECIGPSAISIPLEPPTVKLSQQASFRLRATDPVPSTTATIELQTKSGLQKKIPITLQVAELDQEEIFYEPVSVKSRPVPHPDITFLVHSFYDHAKSTLTFQYSLRRFGITSDETFNLQSRSVSADWINRIDRQLSMVITTSQNGNSEETSNRLKLFGQELAYHLFPDNMWQKFTEIGSRTMLILSQDRIRLPWELLHDGKSFLGQKLIIGRWPRKLNDQRPYEFPIGQLSIAYFSGVEDTGIWQKMMQPPENNAPQTEILPCGTLPGIDTFHSLHGLHLLRRGIRPDEQPDCLPELRDRKECETSMDTEKDEIELGQTRLYLSSNRPMVSLSYLNSRLSGLTNLEQRWASSFISAGASAFVGPMWMVTPAVEAAFVRGFYSALWTGQSLGTAFRLGQKLARSAVPDSLDWMAYVLYGDPMARPYRPVKGDGYAVVQPVGRDIEDPVHPGEKIVFRVSLQRSPPVWNNNRLVEISKELSYENLQAHIITFDLPVEPESTIKMYNVGGDYRGWFTLLIPENKIAKPSPVQIHLTENDESVKTINFSLNIELSEKTVNRGFEA